MKKNLFLLMGLLLTATHVWAEQPDSLKLFVEQHPNEVNINAMSEGSCVALSADENLLLVRLQLAEPALQMRVLMQGMDIYIDPTGRKREKYAIVLPSAFDVRNLVAQPEEGGASKKGNENKRPDMMPLIEALNIYGATLDVNGRKQKFSNNQFRIVLSRDNGLLDYYIMLPKAMLMNEKKLSTTWSVGLYAELPEGAGGPPAGMMQGGPGGGPGGPGGGPGGGGPGGGPGRQQPGGDMAEMAKTINEWHTFSIDDVNNANITVLKENANETDPNQPKISAKLKGDSIVWHVSTLNPHHQLSFLMQGLTLSIGQNESAVSVRFPDAGQVRNQVKRHPNEVKPTFSGDSIGQETRPDLQPLITALCDTVAVVTKATGGSETTRDFNIVIDRENTSLSFSVALPASLFAENAMTARVTSAPPRSFGREFSGQHRSTESKAQQNPGGLGEAPKQPNDAERNIDYSCTVLLQ